MLACRHLLDWMQLREAAGSTVVLLACGTTCMAAFAVADAVKEDAAAVVAALKARGLQVSLCSVWE